MPTIDPRLLAIPSTLSSNPTLLSTYPLSPLQLCYPSSLGYNPIQESIDRSATIQSSRRRPRCARLPNRNNVYRRAPANYTNNENQGNPRHYTD